GWMAMVTLNMTLIAIELAKEEPEYEDIAIQIHAQFFAIANAIHGHTDTGVALWDHSDRFFKDVLDTPFGLYPLPVFSWVGLIPVFGIEIGTPEQLAHLPRYKTFLKNHAGGKYDGNIVCACPHTENPRGDRFFSLALPANVPDIMKRVLNPDEFISTYGVRGLSRIHAVRQELGDIPGVGRTMIAYEPGESQSGLFGGNSNWRGPIWMPLNFLLVRALDKTHRYLTESFTVPAPAMGNKEVTLAEAADLIAERLIGIFRRNERGLRPVYPEESPFQRDPHWRELILFYEYFHGDSGLGLGASHQTGWTALVANLIKRRYERPAREK
ncbi:MAG TPA: glucosidase, partial [Candidatus Methylomirabilis sp.]|nr:glucosidase [Candidatus Methylomirabilis sp.]